MGQKRILAILLLFLYLTIMPFVVRAATITVCDVDKELYNQGETGYITVTLYNDEDEKIRVTELTATIDYYYTDENIYLQTFYSDEVLPIEIQQGQTDSFNIAFSLPSNIAPGYTDFYVRAKTEVWNNQSGIWFGSEHPVSRPMLYIESPYKQLYESEEEANEELQYQFQELERLQATTTSIMYVFGSIAIILAIVTVSLIMLSRKPRAIGQPSV